MNGPTRICLLAAAAAALAAAAGCGTVTAATTGTGPAARSQPGIPGTLCAAAGYVGSLAVSRSDAFPGNHVRFTFPAEVTVGPQEARTVARAVCGLPRMPHGMMSCPADWGIGYRLIFGAGAKPGTQGRRFPAVVVDATGCQQVTGAGPQRWLAAAPGFWTVLGKAMGVADPGTAFRGCSEQGGIRCPKNATYTS